MKGGVSFMNIKVVLGMHGYKDYELDTHTHI